MTVTGVGFLDNVYLNGNYNVEIASKILETYLFGMAIYFLHRRSLNNGQPAGTTQDHSIMKIQALLFLPAAKNYNCQG